MSDSDIAEDLIMGARLTRQDYSEETNWEAVEWGAGWESYRTYWAAVLQQANCADIVQFRLDRGEDCLAVEIGGKTYLLFPPPPEWRPFFLSAARRLAAGGPIRAAARAVWRTLRRSTCLGTISVESVLGTEHWCVEAQPDGITMKRIQRTDAEIRARTAECERLAKQWRKATRDSCPKRAETVAQKIARLFEPDLGAASNPSLALSVIAALCEEVSDWQGAELAYQQKVMLEEPGIGAYAAHDSLSALYYLLGREDEGRKHRGLATSAARDADGIILLTALLTEAGDHLYHKDVAAANALLPEIFRLLEEADPELPQFHARALRLRAACRLASGDLNTAGADLEHAFGLLETANQSCPVDAGPACGLESDLAQCWKLQARLEGLRGSFETSSRLWAKVIDSARRVASGMNTPSCKQFLAGTLREAADSLEQSGQGDLAAEFRTEAQQIQSRLRLPTLECA